MWRRSDQYDGEHNLRMRAIARETNYSWIVIGFDLLMPWLGVRAAGYRIGEEGLRWIHRKSSAVREFDVYDRKAVREEFRTDMKWHRRVLVLSLAIRKRYDS